MSCTVYYEWKIKENVNADDLMETVLRHVESMNISFEKENRKVVINFLKGKSETLVFDFSRQECDDFWKWNGLDAQEFYDILELFHKLTPFFETFDISDDDDIWEELYGCE